MNHEFKNVVLEILRLQEPNTEIRQSHCKACARAADRGEVGTANDCSLRGTLHGTPKVIVPFLRSLFTLSSPYVLRRHNIITNVGHAAANGRMSNQGSYSPFVNLAIGTGTGGAAATDRALMLEIAASGGQRGAATATQTTTSVTNDTTQLVKTFTFTAGFSVTEEGIFDNTTAPVQAVLTAAVTTTGQTAWTVAANSFVNNDYIQVESEIVQITAGGGTTSLTVTRGQLGTTAATHSNGVNLNDITANAGNCLARQQFGALTVINGDSIQFTHKYQT